MKRYRQFIEILESKSGGEIDFSRGLCHLLGGSNPPLFQGSPIDHFRGKGWQWIERAAKEAKNEEIAGLADTMNKWMMGFKAQRDYTPEDLVLRIKRMIQGCGKTGSWLRYSGNVYRGEGFGVKRFANAFKFERITTLYRGKRPLQCAEGTLRYEARSVAQSWTTEQRVALGFATGDFTGVTDSWWSDQMQQQRIHFVLEYKISPDESLNLVHFGNPAESEIVRLEKTPIQCRCYVPLAEKTTDGRETLMSPGAWRLLTPEQKLQVFDGREAVLRKFEDYNSQYLEEKQR
jgi:hypothetical protein